MRTETVTADGALPVLVHATPADQEGVVVAGNLFPPSPVRRLKDDDLDGFLRDLQPMERQEFVATVELIRAYKLRSDPYRKGQGKQAWKEARQKYEQFLAARKQTTPLPEDEKKRREFGRQLIEVVAPACGVDLGTRRPKRAADLWDRYRLSPFVKADPRMLLCQVVSRHLLADAQLVLWYSKDNLQPAIYCQSRRAAVYVRALLSLNERKGFAVCQYSRCKKEVFDQSRPNQACCSPKHANAHRMEVWRMTPQGQRAMKRDAMRRKSKKRPRQRTKKPRPQTEGQAWRTVVSASQPQAKGVKAIKPHGQASLRGVAS